VGADARGEVTPERRAFYEYHSALMEPWDGPAAVTYTDGRIVGTIMDRNGLRPARYVVLDNGLVISASEVGAVAYDESRVIKKGRIGPGQILLRGHHPRRDHGGRGDHPAFCCAAPV
jgi:hypothetical protein